MLRAMSLWIATERLAAETRACSQALRRTSRENKAQMTQKPMVMRLKARFHRRDTGSRGWPGVSLVPTAGGIRRDLARVSRRTMSGGSLSALKGFYLFALR